MQNETQVTENQEVRAEKPLTVEQSNVLTTLYSEGYDYIFNYLRKCVNNTAKAESLTSDVFWKVQSLLKNDNFAFNPKKSSVTTYLQTIAKSVLIDSTRTNVGYNKNTSKVSDFVDSEGNEFLQFEAAKTANADDKILTSELHSNIANAFRTLKPKYRKISILYFLRGYKGDEVAAMVNMPIGSVKPMLMRAKKVLQRELQGDFIIA